ncbi:MAG: ABC transporter substrate-binding protein, partial [Actinomycetota bacterium]
IVDATGAEFTFDEPPVLGCAWYGCIESAAVLGVDLFASVVTPDENAQPFYGSGNTEVFISDSTNPEEWAAAGVDVIMASVAGAGAPATEAMEQAAPVFYLYYDNFLGEPFEVGGQESYIRNLDVIAQLGNKPAAAEKAIGEYEAMVATLESLATPETEAQSLAVLFAMDGYAGLGPDSAFCQLLNDTGHGTCVGEGVGALLNAEAFFGFDPDLILHTTFAGENTVANREANDPIWNQLSAVQSGEVYETDSSRFYCCSTSAQIMMAQEYVGLVFPDAGIERPDLDNFDPSQSPLVTG